MKRLVIGAALTGGAAFALRPLARKARKMHDHCRDMIAGRDESKPIQSSGCSA